MKPIRFVAALVAAVMMIVQPPFSQSASAQCASCQRGQRFNRTRNTTAEQSAERDGVFARPLFAGRPRDGGLFRRASFRSGGSSGGTYEASCGRASEAGCGQAAEAGCGAQGEPEDPADYGDSSSREIHVDRIINSQAAWQPPIPIRVERVRLPQQLAGPVRVIRIVKIEPSYMPPIAAAF